MASGVSRDDPFQFLNAPVIEEKEVETVVTYLSRHSIKEAVKNLSPDKVDRLLGSIHQYNIQHEESDRHVEAEIFARFLQLANPDPLNISNEQELLSIIDLSSSIMEGITDVEEKALILDAIARMPKEERSNVVRLAKPLMENTNASQKVAILQAIPKIKDMHLIQPIIAGISDGYLKVSLLKSLIKKWDPVFLRQAGLIMNTIPKGMQRDEILQAFAQMSDGAQNNLVLFTHSFLAGIGNAKEKVNILKVLIEIPEEERQDVIDHAKPVMAGLTEEFAEVLKVLAKIPQEKRESVIARAKPHMKDIQQGSKKAGILESIAQNNDKFLQYLHADAIRKNLDLIPPEGKKALLSIHKGKFIEALSYYANSRNKELAALAITQDFLPSMRLTVLAIFAEQQSFLIAPFVESMNDEQLAVIFPFFTTEKALSFLRASRSPARLIKRSTLEVKKRYLEDPQFFTKKYENWIAKLSKQNDPATEKLRLEEEKKRMNFLLSSLKKGNIDQEFNDLLAQKEAQINYMQETIAELISQMKPPEEQKFPEEFIDPITQEVMQDPVILPDGNIVDRSSLRKNKFGLFVNPFNRQSFSESELKSATDLKTRINNYK